MTFVCRGWSRTAAVPIAEGMRTMACRAVAQAALSATTASLDDEEAWPLLLVAGWLTTAADLVRQADAADAVLV
jgi:hypothetical protein